MKNCKTLIFGILLMIISSNLYSQKRELEKADQAFSLHEYDLAKDIYLKAYGKLQGDKVKKAEVTFKIAECYRYTGISKKAESWYKKAIKRKYPDPLTYMYYADMLRMNEKYEEAVVQYRIYKDKVPDDERGEYGEQACELSAKWKNNPTRHIVENMAFFNSKEGDFSPTFAKKDYKIVFFTSSRQGSTGEKVSKVSGQYYTDLYQTSLDRKGKWSVPTPLVETINSEYDEGASSLNKKANTLFFTRCRFEKNKKLGCQIYSAKKKGVNWDIPILLNIAADSVDVKHPSLSADETTLYFTATMPGGYGGRDIWMVKREKKNKPFGEPINVGPEINTRGNEAFPYIHADGRLFFSSDYHLGMGGLDIFVAEKGEDGKWTVKNLQYPINSAADDFGIIYEGTKEKGFFTSNRRGGKGGDDIYSFLLPPKIFTIEGFVKDEKTDEVIIGAKVKIRGDDGFTLEMNTEADGSFKFKLSPEVDYVITAQIDEYLLGKINESTKGLDENKDFLANIILSPIVKFEDIPLPNIEYDYNKATLRPESMVELDKLVETMEDNPTITIELNSHTDYIGSDDANITLSNNRAKSVVDYLSSKGISADRMQSKGFGESKPKTVTKEDAITYPFLKAGDNLNEEFIKSLESEEQQLGANQLNRRTSFKILSTDYVPQDTHKEQVEEH